MTVVLYPPNGAPKAYPNCSALRYRAGLITFTHTFEFGREDEVKKTRVQHISSNLLYCVFEDTTK